MLFLQKVQIIMKLHKLYSIKYHVRAIATALLFLAGNIACQAQNPDKTERKQLFDNNWKFFQGDIASAKSKDFNDMGWRSLDLPHDWSIEGKISPKNPTGGAGGYFPAGIGWYRKAFKAPGEWKGKKVSIYFEGVYMNSEVFINGKSLGIYPYGYSSFNYDLSPFLDFNNEKCNSREGRQFGTSEQQVVQWFRDISPRLDDGYRCCTYS
jgi:beta-galactosidase